MKIHSTAIIDKCAELDSSVEVGPYCIIGPKVKIGAETVLNSHVVIEGNTSIGKKNKFFQFSSIGAVPQDLKYHGEDSRLEIGDANTIREYVTLQPGTSGGGMLTKIGNNNLFMANTHVGHDCIIGNANIMANSAALSGHVLVGNNVTIGGLAAIHQFVRLGNYAFIGGGAMVTADIPMYCTCVGDRAKLTGLNQVGLSRNGFNDSQISQLKKLYREIFYASGVLKTRIAELKTKYAAEKICLDLLEFIESSPRGIAIPRKTQEQNS